MTPIVPRSAMVFAAGLGTRMRPLTEDLPKALLPLGDRTLLDHTLDRLAAAGVERVVVNAFWRAERIEAHLATRRRAGLAPPSVISREAHPLDTGGGVRAALHLLGTEPFHVVNGNSFWLDGPHPALARLAEALQADREADVVLLVQRTTQVHGLGGLGDFALDDWGRPRRRREREVVPYMYAGAQLMRPRLLEDCPEGAFSMNLAWDRAIEAGRIRAVVHDGLWFHLSTPADLNEAETVLRAGLPG